MSGLFAGAEFARAEGVALYRWEAPDGSVSFTDDAKRIPEKYREEAVAIDRTAFADYGRYTPTDREATDEYTERLTERLDALREANEGAEPAVREAAPLVAPRVRAAAPVTREINRRRRFVQPDGSVRYRYYEDQTTAYDGAAGSLPVDPNDPNPVVTERRRVKIAGQPMTKTLVVTRQGDRVLSVTSPAGNYHTLDFGSTADFERPNDEE